MKSKKVEIEIQQKEDGHWLIFKSSSGNTAMINVENTFCTPGGIVDPCIRQWAKDQFK